MPDAPYAVHRNSLEQGCLSSVWSIPFSSIILLVIIIPLFYYAFAILAISDFRSTNCKIFKKIWLLLVRAFVKIEKSKTKGQQLCSCCPFVRFNEIIITCKRTFHITKKSNNLLTILPDNGRLCRACKAASRFSKWLLASPYKKPASSASSDIKLIKRPFSHPPACSSEELAFSRSPIPSSGWRKEIIYCYSLCYSSRSGII